MQENFCHFPSSVLQLPFFAAFPHPWDEGRRWGIPSSLCNFPSSYPNVGTQPKTTGVTLLTLSAFVAVCAVVAHTFPTFPTFPHFSHLAPWQPEKKNFVFHPEILLLNLIFTSRCCFSCCLIYIYLIVAAAAKVSLVGVN